MNIINKYKYEYNNIMINNLAIFQIFIHFLITKFGHTMGKKKKKKKKKKLGQAWLMLTHVHSPNWQTVSEMPRTV